MQTPVFTGSEVQEKKWYKTRTAIAGLLLLAIGLFYTVLVLPAANLVPISNYRFPFSFETNIYIIALIILGIHWVFRLARPAQTPVRAEPVGKLDIVGMILRTAFLLTVGGSYVSGAAISTPSVFGSFLPASLVGQSVVFLAQFVHSLFASLLIGIGLAIVVYEIAKIATHKSTWSRWLVRARYPEIKVLYWMFAIGVIYQGILGLFLLGTFSPIGPFALVAPNGYAFESLARHIHGPTAAVLISIFYAHVYFRIRPEFHIR